MIKRIRDYGKKEPSRDAHKIYVVCEGSEDEKNYFSFFEGLSSNLNVITIPSEEGRTDPLQLMARAKVLFDEEAGRYSLDYKQGDRVWFVVDTDTWEDEGKIAPLRAFCEEMNEGIPVKLDEVKQYNSWNVAQSNPAFEIWLYYHFYDKAPVAGDVAKYASFKAFVNHSINGGFNYEKDPVRLKVAIDNAQGLFNRTEGSLVDLYSTEVYLLGQEIDGFVSEELEKLYNKLR